MKTMFGRLAVMTAVGSLSLGGLSALPAHASNARHSAKVADRDHDGMPDSWEKANHLNPNNPHDANQDPDHDGLTNRQEFTRGGNPHSPDTDGDGIDDEDEALVHGHLAGRDANHNGRVDGQDDSDHDGVTNADDEPCPPPAPPASPSSLKSHDQASDDGCSVDDQGTHTDDPHTPPADDDGTAAGGD